MIEFGAATIELSTMGLCQYPEESQLNKKWQRLGEDVEGMYEE